MTIIFLSLLAGFLIAMPAAGPASALILRNLFAGRYREGLSFAAGSVLAEGLVCLAAIWGVELVFYTAPQLRSILEYAGTLLLLVVGAYLLATGASEPDTDEQATATEESSLGGRILAGFAMTALNPTLLATWTSMIGLIVATSGVELAQWQRWTVPLVIAGGELAWFATLAAVVQRFAWMRRARLVEWVIRALGAVLIALGTWGAYRLLVAA